MRQRCRAVRALFRLFEQTVESRASIAWRSRRSLGRGNVVVFRCGVASYRHTRLEQLTFIGLIFDRNADGHRLQALKARRRLKMSALLAAVQRSPAFGTLPLPIRV